MAPRKTTSKSGDKLDRGTVETRRRLPSDPLLSSTIDPHGIQAALALREALKDGLSAPGLDMVRIGIGGGASNGERSLIPTTPANTEYRTCHQRCIDYTLEELHPPVRSSSKTTGPNSNSAVNPKRFDPTSDEAVAYTATLEDIANIAQARRSYAALVDRVTKLKACIDLLTTQIAKMPLWER